MVKILLIDDDDDLLELTESRLCKKGFEVTAVSSLTAARQVWGQAPMATFDAVVSDLFLKNENGLTFFEQLRAAGYLETFVLVTGDAEGDTRIRTYLHSSPGFHCLQKPYPFETLVDLLAHSCARSA